MVLVGGMDTGWKPRGGRRGEKSSLLSDDAASSSSEDMSTTAGCKDVMCVRRAYANSQHRGVRRNVVYWNPNGRSSMISCAIKSFKRHSQGMSLFMVCVFVF